ncbi:hypothetical protein QYE76_002958 [Lolium multiflorum]|uniref:Uncharacterized protein n=1 Tax=Lolium multiflorum TaxID=4521 RepID=A0AAD8RP95_LOLMU|nr:hypothetical protein QYE76_002958 [Lolium multiflorum]
MPTASWPRHGAWTRDYSSMDAASSCRIMETCATRPCPWRILHGTRRRRSVRQAAAADVPSQVWADISMDFIEGLPKVGGKSVILTVVDRFSKYAHFIARPSLYGGGRGTRFFDGIVRLHGFPSSIVDDRDPVFTGHVWRDLFGLAGVKLRMSTAFHPQTDGQSEVLNKIIAMYLRITGDRPRAWVDWLAWAEYATTYHSALHATPFEVVYGRPPPRCFPMRRHGPSRRRMTCCVPVDEIGEARRDFFGSVARSTMMHTIARRNLRWAIGSGYAFFTGRPSPWTRAPGASWDLVTPVLSVCWSASASSPTALSCCGLAPPRRLQRRPLKAYRATLLLHQLFHLLRMGVSSLPRVARVLKAQQRRGVWHVLVHWTGLPEDEATWEKLEDLRQQFPEVQLEDECLRRQGEMLWSV